MAYRGMFLKKTKPTEIKEAVWWEEHCIRRQGGYNFDQSNIPATTKWIPKGTVLKLTTDGNAAVVKTAEVIEDAASGATAIKVASGSLLKVGDSVDGNDITAITVGVSYDTLTVAATTKKIAKGTVVSDYNAKTDTVLGLSYDTFEIEADAQQMATPTLQVLEVEKDSLPYPVNDDIVAGINANGVIRFRIQ